MIAALVFLVSLGLPATTTANRLVVGTLLGLIAYCIALLKLDSPLLPAVYRKVRGE